MAPALRHMETVALGRYELIESAGRLSFRLGGVDRWVLDTRRFDGHPRLELERADDTLRLLLRGARFPGTDISAELTAEVRPALIGSRMRLHMRLGDVHLSVPFERWLAGLDPALGTLASGSTTLRLGPVLVVLEGPCTVALRPDTGLALQGPGVARLRLDDGWLEADELRLSLLLPGQASLVDDPAPRRSLLSLSRGSRSWTKALPLPAHPVGRLVADGEPFDLLSVEAGAGTTPQVALLAEGADRDGAVAFVLSVPHGRGRHPGRLPLRLPRLAMLLNGAAPQAAFSARFGRRPAWLDLDGCRVQLGDAAHALPFELHRFGSTLRLRCDPALLAVGAPLAGASATRAWPTRPARLSFGDDPEPAADPDPVAPQQRGQIRVRPQIRVRLPTDLTVSVLRPDDFLAVGFAFVNLRLEQGATPRLVRADAAAPAFVILQLPPQHVLEEAFFESAGPALPLARDDADARRSSATLPSPPVKGRLSGPSRLVFRVPTGIDEVPYTLAALLEACRSFPLQVSPAARPPRPPPSLSRALTQLISGWRDRVARTRTRRAIQLATPAEIEAPQAAGRPALRPALLAPGPADPSERQTAIEAPYRLIVSPHWESAWNHAIEPFSGTSPRTELWHTRLGVRADDGSVDEDDEHYRTVRAIWSPDYSGAGPPTPADDPFRASLDRRDRHELVALTSDFSAGKEPLPVRMRRLMLTPLGAWFDGRGTWEPQAPLEVEEWRHLATFGRDHYVRVVYKGYLFPFRHRASIVKVTERKFQRAEQGESAGQMIAYLRQRMFIVVREPEVLYDTAGLPGGLRLDRLNPFKRVRITTQTTPDLDDPAASQIGGFGRQGFWPRVGSSDFLFHLVAWDWRGERSELTAPLIFVGQEHDNAGDLDVVIEAYAASGQRARRRFAGQKVAFAPPANASPGEAVDNTTLETEEIAFAAERPGGSGAAPGFYPTLASARVRIPAVQAMVGGQASGIKYSAIYAEKGLGGPDNVSEIFAEMEAATPLRYRSDQSGGIATPNLNIAGLSRRFGPVGGTFNSPPDLSDLAKGVFDPATFFEGAAAKILGGIGLADILDSSFGDGKQLPKLSTSLVYPNGDTGRLPEAIRADLLWEPTVKSDPLGIFVPGDDAKLLIQARSTKRLDAPAQGPDLRIEGLLTDFEIDLIAPVMSFLRVRFKSFSFRSSSGTKMDVDPQIDEVVFDGPLKFINELQEYIPMGGSFVDVTEQGVQFGYDLALPAITAGVLNLQNIAFGIGLNIPFTGDPVRLRLAFCERENPFLLTVYCFGGGGFVGLALGLDGVERLEVSLEFGAATSLDIGVASGSVAVTAGVYMMIENEACALTGYLRAVGALEVMAIVTLSLEFYMGLTYETAGNLVWGEARLSVEIEIAFVAIPLEMSVRREFTDPELARFRDMMSEPEWIEYCDAFA